MFTFRGDADHAIRAMQGVAGEDAIVAAAKALTFTAQDTQRDEVAEMRRVFDRPTPFTLRGTFIKPATAQRLESRVWLKDDKPFKGTAAAKYLRPQVFGGYRPFKRFEWALKNRGVLPVGYYALPGEGARLNAYGNMSAGQILQILSVLGAAEMRSGYSANVTPRSRKRNRKPRDYFPVAPGNDHNLEPGVYERKRGGGIVPVLLFVRKAAYESRFDFYAVAGRTFAAKFKPHYHRALASLIARRR